MNKLTVLFGVLLCMIVVNARHYGEHIKPEKLTDDDEHGEFEKEIDHTNPSRHRRRRWQSNFGYDYQPPSRSYYDRRDNYYSQQDSIQHILRLLDEISASIRGNQRTPPPPPPPPQPIYIPYPVPYYVPVLSNGVSCKPMVPKYPNITDRFPAMEDINQNWGFEDNKNDDYEDDTADSRPISFDPIKPIQPLKRPAPKVEHGSSQASQATTRSPSFSEPSASGRAPSMCHAAILSCCGLTDEKQQKQCFTNVGCSITYTNGNACSPNSINEALETFRNTYAPVSN